MLRFLGWVRKGIQSYSVPLVVLLILGGLTSGSHRAAAATSDCNPTIETNIGGEYKGWDDEVIYKMDNGQIWQQANYHYHYHYAYRPAVIIYPTSHGCHIKVNDDDDEGVDVVRLK